MSDDRGTITDLLVAWGDGDQQALEALMPLVYEHLKGMAANHLRGERRAHTLQTTALVNEAFLRLVRQDRMRWEHRAHFYAIAARLMRRILVDHARHHDCSKRDNRDTVRLSPTAFDQLPTERPQDLVALDDALAALAQNDPTQAQIIELRFFGGLTKSEIACALGISTATVTRRWRLARAWLYNDLVKGVSHPS